MALPVVAITNQSTVLTDAQVQAVIPALQHQVSLDVLGYWGVDCTLQFLPKDQPLVNGWWQLVVIDDPDMAGALGYHELSSVGGPLGKVFAKLDIQSGTSWTVTMSHELLEMLVDPWINVCAQGNDGKIYAYEVGDPVEADELGYEIDGVLVSDFITPDWFSPTQADRYDFKQHITQAYQLAPGGYVSILDPRNGWTQVTAQKATGKLARQTVKAAVKAKVVPVGSRRDRRTNHANWQKSEV